MKKGEQDVFLWVEQVVCDQMARQQFFIDLLALKQQAGADKALFTSFTSIGYQRRSRLHSAISPAYHIENVLYSDDNNTDEMQAQDGAAALVYMRSLLLMQDWVDQVLPPARIKLVLVANSDCFEAVIEAFAFADIEVYTNNPKIVMALARKKGMGSQFLYHDFAALPRRFLPEKKEARN